MTGLLTQVLAGTCYLRAMYFMAARALKLQNQSGLVMAIPSAIGVGKVAVIM